MYRQPEKVIQKNQSKVHQMIEKITSLQQHQASWKPASRGLKAGSTRKRASGVTQLSSQEPDKGRNLRLSQGAQDYSDSQRKKSFNLCKESREQNLKTPQPQSQSHSSTQKPLPLDTPKEMSTTVLMDNKDFYSPKTQTAPQNASQRRVALKIEAKGQQPTASPQNEHALGVDESWIADNTVLLNSFLDNASTKYHLNDKKDPNEKGESKAPAGIESASFTQMPQESSKTPGHKNQGVIQPHVQWLNFDQKPKTAGNMVGRAKGRSHQNLGVTKQIQGYNTQYKQKQNQKRILSMVNGIVGGLCSNHLRSPPTNVGTTVVGKAILSAQESSRIVNRESKKLVENQRVVADFGNISFNSDFQVPQTAENPIANGHGQPTGTTQRRAASTAHGDAQAHSGSNSFLEEIMQAGNQTKILSRAGNYKSTGIPFFIEQIGKNRMIRTNKSHFLRNNQHQKFKFNCKPLTMNYIQDRMAIGERHMNIVKQMRMERFEQKLNAEKRQEIMTRENKSRARINASSMAVQTEDETLKLGDTVQVNTAKSNVIKVSTVIQPNQPLAHVMENSGQVHQDKLSGTHYDNSLIAMTPDHSMRKETTQEQEKSHEEIGRVLSDNTQRSVEQTIENRCKTTEGVRVSYSKSMIQNHYLQEISILEKNDQENIGLLQTRNSPEAQAREAEQGFFVTQKSSSQPRDVKQLTHVGADLEQLQGLYPIHDNTGKFQYIPIPSKVQRLTNIQLNQANGEHKMLNHQRSHCRSRQEKLQKTFGSNATDLDQLYEYQDSLLSNFHEKVSKPIWVVGTKNQSNQVVNYKTEQGKSLNKISNGEISPLRYSKLHAHQGGQSSVLPAPPGHRSGDQESLSMFSSKDGFLIVKGMKELKVKMNPKIIDENRKNKQKLEMDKLEYSSRRNSVPVYHKSFENLNLYPIPKNYNNISPNTYFRKIIQNFSKIPAIQYEQMKQYKQTNRDLPQPADKVMVSPDGENFYIIEQQEMVPFANQVVTKTHDKLVQYNFKTPPDKEFETFNPQLKVSTSSLKGDRRELKGLKLKEQVESSKSEVTKIITMQKNSPAGAPSSERKESQPKLPKEISFKRISSKGQNIKSSAIGISPTLEQIAPLEEIDHKLSIGTIREHEPKDEKTETTQENVPKNEGGKASKVVYQKNKGSVNTQQTFTREFVCEVPFKNEEIQLPSTAGDHNSRVHQKMDQETTKTAKPNSENAASDLIRCSTQRFQNHLKMSKPSRVDSSLIESDNNRLREALAMHNAKKHQGNETLIRIQKFNHQRIKNDNPLYPFLSDIGSDQSSCTATPAIGPNPFTVNQNELFIEMQQLGQSFIIQALDDYQPQSVPRKPRDEGVKIVTVDQMLQHTESKARSSVSTVHKVGLQRKDQVNPFDETWKKNESGDTSKPKPADTISIRDDLSGMNVRHEPTSPGGMASVPGSGAERGRAAPEAGPFVRQADVVAINKGTDMTSHIQVLLTNNSPSNDSKPPAANKGLEAAMRLPIYANPPEYLKKESFGVKQQYQTRLRMHTTSAPVHQKAQSRGAAAEFELGHLNIRNLCNQSRAVSRDKRNTRLLPVGIVQTEKVDEPLGDPFVPQLNQGKRKTRDFYHSQLDKTACKKGRLMISKINDPVFRVEGGRRHSAGTDQAAPALPASGRRQSQEVEKVLDFTDLTALEKQNSSGVNWNEHKLIENQKIPVMLSKTGSLESQLSAQPQSQNLMPRDHSLRASNLCNHPNSSQAASRKEEDREEVKPILNILGVPQAAHSQGHSPAPLPKQDRGHDYGGKQDFRRAVKRDFKVLVPANTDKGYNGADGSHVRQFQRVRSRTLVQQLAGQRQRRKSHKPTKGEAPSEPNKFYLVLNQRDECPDDRSKASTQQEFMNPLRVVQESLSAAGIGSQGDKAKAPPQHGEQPSAEPPATTQTDLEKVTLDSFGINQLAQVANLRDDSPRRERAQPKQTQQHSAAPEGGRQLFDLPTSVVEDLYKEQKEFDEASQIPFGLIGTQHELRPLKDWERAQRPFLQEFFREKQLRQRIQNEHSLIQQASAGSSVARD